MTDDSSERLAAVCAVLAAFLAVAGTVFGAPATTERVTRGPVVHELVESGDVRATASRDVNAPADWRMDLQILWLHPEGVVVSPGDTLVQLDPAAAELELAVAVNERAEREADLQRIEAELSQQRQQLRNQVRQASFRTEQTELQLQKLEFESESKRNEARLELQKAEAARTEAEAKLRAFGTIDSLETAKAGLRIQEAADRIDAEMSQIAAMTLTAPISGLVVHADDREKRRKLRAGDIVGGRQSIVFLPDLSRIEAVVELNEVDRERVFVGQSARVSLDAYPDLDLPGEVSQVARLALPAREASAVRVFRAHVRVDGTDERLKPGMTAKVRLALDHRDDVLRIPRGALFTSADGSTVVFPSADWPEPRAVRAGLASSRWVEALDGVQLDDALSLEAPAGSGAVSWRGSGAVRPELAHESSS